MSSLINALPGAMSQGLIWGIMAIGLYITYRILEVSDLTVDGSFCTGGAVCAVMLIAGYNVWVAMLVAMLAGMLTGLVTGILHTVFKIPAILSGILTQLGLWSINLAIMGMKANTALNVNKYDMMVSLRYLQDVSKGTRPFWQHPLFTVGVATVAIIVVLYWFFGTARGCSIRATGANVNMARAQGINTNMNITIGLMIANGLVALSGAMLAQYQGFADINMGRGAIVIGLAAVIIGEVAFGKIFRNFGLKLLAVSIGAVIYYMVIQAVISLLDIDSNYLKLISASIVAVFLAVPNLRSMVFGKGRKEASMLKIENVRKVFNPGTVNEKVALNGLNLELQPGDFVTVIGGNGAGKSTMLNCVAGVYPLDGGRICIGGTDVSHLPEYKRAKFIGRVFQDPMMGTAATMQIEENLALALRRGAFRGLGAGITRKEREMYREALKILDLGLEDRMTAKVGLLSGGQRQALTLLMATLRKPELLLLDEHTAALDPKTAAKVLEATKRIVERDNLTTMMITHNMRDAIAYGNRLIMMYDGHIVVDVSGEEKKNLTVEQLLNLFSVASGSDEADDKLLLSKGAE